METILYLVVVTLLGTNMFLFRKNLKDKQRHNQDYERFLSDKTSIESDHANRIAQLLEQSRNDISNIKQETIDVMTEANGRLRKAEDEISDANEQIQQMYQYIDSLVETIYGLSETYDDLKDYSFEIHERLVEFNLFLINKLRGGFLQDNEEVRELVNQIRTFLRDSQDIQDRHGDLFLKDDDNIESIDEEISNDIEGNMEEFFDEGDGGVGYEPFPEEFPEDTILKNNTLSTEPNFRIKRSYFDKFDE